MTPKIDVREPKLTGQSCASYFRQTLHPERDPEVHSSHVHEITVALL